MNPAKYFVCTLAAALILILNPSSVAAQQRFNANLSGAQVVPPTSSTARATCQLAIAEATGTAVLECEYSNLVEARNIRLHRNLPVGQNGPPDVSFSIAGPNGVFGLTVMGLEPADFQAIRSNRWCIVLTTADLPGGAIRGQIKLANGTYNDYDGDGRTDLQVYRNSNNTFYALRSADGAYIEQQLGQPGDSVSLTVDFDGDGRSDFSTARYNAEVLWRILPSTTNILRETRWGSSTLGDFFAAADYDGDMKMDLGVFRAGVWHILQSSDGAYTQQYWGTAGDVPVLADFDRDGKADVTIARSESGQRMWYTRMSSNGSMRVTPWGLSSDAFFTGRVDFDGDSAADIMVIRNESGQRVFYILRSSDSQMQVMRWGLSSDVVKLGDYDGDARTDPAVTRAENGQRVFYILPSSAAQPRVETFGLAGDF